MGASQAQARDDRLGVGGCDAILEVGRIQGRISVSIVPGQFWKWRQTGVWKGDGDSDPFTTRFRDKCNQLNPNPHKSIVMPRSEELQQRNRPKWDMSREEQVVYPSTREPKGESRASHLSVFHSYLLGSGQPASTEEEHEWWYGMDAPAAGGKMCS